MRRPSWAGGASTRVSTRHARVRALLLLAVAGGLFADDEVKTEHLDFPSGGTLRVKNSTGELTVEAWDQSGIEITTIKSPKNAAASLELAQVKVERQKDEVVVTTTFPKHGALVRPFTGLTNVRLEYRIKAPRSARLIVDHNNGEVHIDGITGELHVTDHKGLITIHAPQDGQYAIDAKAKLGAIDSDFPGREQSKLKFGHTFINEASPSSQKMYLAIGFGDITILAIHRPQNPK
jgi:hypothetical protein